MKKLLDRSLRPLLIYSLVVLMLSIPVYFLLIDITWKEELDKHHREIRFKIENRINQLAKTDTERIRTIAILNIIEPGFILTPVTAADIRPDSTYNSIRFDEFIQEREQFRSLVTYIRIQNQTYRLLIETNMEEIDETITIISSVAIFFIIILLFGFIYLTRRSSLKMWQPFYQTLTKIKNFDLNQTQEVKLPASNIIEFNELNTSLNTLIHHNISTYRKQKEFTENAAHELQTPLAIIKLKLDLLMQSDSLTPQQAKYIDQSLSALNRATRINKNLLLLAKIENRQFNNDVSLDFVLVLNECLLHLEDYIGETRWQLLTSNKLQKHIQADETLVQILCNNLLINAINHSSKSSNINITLTDTQLTISNAGQAPLNQEALFQRFKKSVHSKNGTGLGLAIAKEICNQYHWKLQYEFIKDNHIFTVIF